MRPTAREICQKHLAERRKVVRDSITAWVMLNCPDAAPANVEELAMVVDAHLAYTAGEAFGLGLGAVEFNTFKGDERA